MVRIKPFRAVRPPKEHASEVASRPYDVLNSAEAKAEATERSLLHIIKPEIDFDPIADEHSQPVYDKAVENFRRWQFEGWLQQDPEEYYYIYAQTMEGRTQYGLAMCCHFEDYLSGAIKKHELTRPDKEEDRMIHVRNQKANIEPVFFAYPDNAEIDAIVADVVPPRRRALYLSIMGVAYAVPMLAGPLLGGFFADAVGWRWAFWFDVPLALAAIVIAAVFLPKPRRTAERAPFDVGGAVTLVAAVTALTLATLWGGNEHAWTSPTIIGLLVATAVASALFVLAERRAREPLMALSLFKNRNFDISIVASSITMFVMIGVLTYLPTYFQIVDGLAPEQAGLMTFPMMAGVLLTAVGTGFLATKTGRYKWMPIASCAVAAVGFVLLSRLTPDTSLLVTGVFLFVLGFGIGLGQQILVLIVQNEFPHAIVGTATAANNFFRQIGSTLGASLVGALFTSRLTADLAAKLPHVDNINMNRITPDFVQHLDSGTRAVITSAYSDALVPIFLYVVPLLVVGFVLMLTLKEHPLATKVNHTGHPGDTV